MQIRSIISKEKFSKFEKGELLTSYLCYFGKNQDGYMKKCPFNKAQYICLKDRLGNKKWYSTSLFIIKTDKDKNIKDYSLYT